MSGLSAATSQRLAELEAKPELASVERGELRAMAHSKPTAEERARVDRLLAASATTSSPSDSPLGVEAYARGLESARATGSTAYTRGT